VGFIPQQIEDWGPSPEQRFAQTEMRDILRGVIEELTPDFRIVFVLRDVEGLSTEETAEAVESQKPREIAAVASTPEATTEIGSSLPKGRKAVNCDGVVRRVSNYIDGDLEVSSSRKSSYT